MNALAISLPQKWSKVTPTRLALCMVCSLVRGCVNCSGNNKITPLLWVSYISNSHTRFNRVITAFIKLTSLELQ